MSIVFNRINEEELRVRKTEDSSAQNRFRFLTVLLFLFGTAVSFAQFGADSAIHLKTYLSFDKVQPGTELKIAGVVRVDSSFHVNSNKPKEDFLIPTELSIDTTTGFRFQTIVYPEAHDYSFSFSDTPMSVFAGEFTIAGLVKIPEGLKPGKYPISIILSYQPCNDEACYAPNEIIDTVMIEVVDNSVSISEINAEVFSGINLQYTKSETTVQSGDSDVEGMLEKSGLLLALLLVFLGGLALNLTPCVYPLIPITISFFGGQSEGKTSRLALMGLLYVLGLSVTYTAVGVVTAMTGALFGALLQNTYVILVIAAILSALALSMFGLYEFRMPNALVQKAGGSRGGLFGAFFMGMTLGIVAAPCIGPFVLGLVTFVAKKQDVFLGFIMFFVLSLGLGLPYFVLAIFSGKIKKLPRSGEWMLAVEHIFGVILFGMAIYFVLPILPKGIGFFVLPIFLIAGAVYILFFDRTARSVKAIWIVRIVLSTAMIAFAVYSFIPSAEGITWKQYEQTAYDQAAGKQPIIIDFYADWCIPCKELDKLTFTDPAVIKKAGTFATFKADLTKSTSPEVEALTKKFSITGVPTVIFLDAGGKEITRITGFVPAPEFLKLMEKTLQ